jgi:gliding motility-associated-like protein
LKRLFQIYFFLIPWEFSGLIAQCPGSETCNGAYLFCSIKDLDGFTCNSKGDVFANCRPECTFSTPPVGGGRHWWSFVSQGGDLTISLTAGDCYCSPPCNTGTVSLFFGIFGDCNCIDVATCMGVHIYSGQTLTQTAHLKPCKKYYLVVDNNGWMSWCDFTINASIDNGLSLDHINNISSDIIEPICQGACNYKFFVNPIQNDCMNPKYIWTLDGQMVGGSNNEIELNFPDEGDFILCVSVISEFSNNGSTCPIDIGPRCTTVKVRRLPDRIGKKRSVCYGYKWHSQLIYTPGIYHQEFKDKNCCKYDSVIEFNILPDAAISNVFSFNCNNMTYVDLLGRSYNTCQDHVYITLPNSTAEFKCDSSIILTFIRIKDSLNWQTKCIGDKVEHFPNFSIINQCGIGESYKFEYSWYKKSDTLKTVLSRDDRLVVDAKNDDYCLDVKIKVYLGSDSAFCTKTYCDTINEVQSGGTIENILYTFCDSALYNGQTYYESTQFSKQYKNVFGCDSIVNTILSVQKNSLSEIPIKSCDSLVVNGKVFYQSGKDTQFLRSSNGCDSTIITDLIITKSTTAVLAFQGCDSLDVNNQIYYQSGNYIQYLINVDNCDSILNLNLTIGKTKKVDLKMTGCDSLVIGGKVYYQTGIYPEVYQGVTNCDSIVSLDLTIFKTQRDSLSFSDCDKVVYKGKIYTQTGDYPEFYTDVHGCDSMVNVHINITSSNKGQLNEAKCDSTTINNIYYDQTGMYTQKLKSANGCDSILNIDLTIGHKSFSNYSYTHCDSAILNGQWFYSTGNYTQTIKNTFQCDSTIDINLTINKSTSGDTIFRSCDSVIINGITYRQTGIYQQTLSNAMQCDSNLIIDFTRLSKSSTNLKYKSCDSIELNKIVYKQSGLYSQKLSNINQCDSLLSLDITINKGTVKDSTAQGCDSLIFNGQTYYQSGNYNQKLTNADLCDSSLNLSLIIYKSSTTDNILRACDSVFKFGKWFYQSGNYPQYLKDVHLCDSTVNLQLTITPSTKSTIFQTACDSIVINGKTYFVSGNYSQYLTSSNGCDSTLLLDLTIKPGNPSTLDAGKDTSVCEGEVIKLNGVFSGNANFSWQSSNGNFDNPNNLVTNFYSKVIGDEKIYLQAADDCKQWIDSINVHIYPRQLVQITGDTLVSPCKEIRFTASGGTNYIWTPSSYVECLDPPCSRVILKSSSITKFTINTDGPCAIPASLNLTLSQVQTDVYLPNAFSPNGDNINDIFLPVFNCEQVEYFSLQIFDRWGNLLFESLNKDKGWNGKYKDQAMNPGVYPYLIQYQVHGGEKKVKAGDVTLVR